MRACWCPQLDNKAIMRLPDATADRLALCDSAKYTHSFTQFVVDRYKQPWKWMLNWRWIDWNWRGADRYGFLMMLEMDWYCFLIDWRSGRRRHVTMLLEMLTFIYKIYGGTLTLVSDSKSMRAFDQIRLSLMCSCCGTFFDHCVYLLRHNNHANFLATLSLMVTQHQQFNEPLHMEVM